ncbi:MAG: CotH kinase family protein [Ruminococcus sp.]|nr:CotH kinase family protein [Ruminococcus sp.]
MKLLRTTGALTALLLLSIAGFYKLSAYQTAHNDTDPAGIAAGTDTDTARLYVTIAGYDIALWPHNGQYYAFMPSACKDAGLDVTIPENIDPSSIVWMYSQNLPAVFIETESGTCEQINTDKNIQESGTISVLEADGNHDFNLPLTYIKGRGNTSYTEFAKKPYQIKLADSAPLLGMDSARKWVFVSNASDPTLVRNALSRDLAAYLELPQADNGVFVDLYINSEYVGNYYVTEKIEVKRSRLPITDLEKATEIANDTNDLSTFETAWTETTKAKAIPEEPDDITGGYLIERDFDDRFLKEVETNGSYFITDAHECFILRAPEYASQNQIVYINDYIQSVENAILSPDGIDAVTGKSYDELIDTDSFVRKYLLEEVTANYDGGVASSFFYKDSSSKDDKLYAGPVWDYDVTWGNSPRYLGYVSTSPDRLSRLAEHSDSSCWFSSLYAKPEFYEQIVSLYRNEISAYLQTLVDEVLPQLADMTAASAAMDRVRWEEEYIANGTPESRQEALAFLSDYIRGRRTFLDKAWIEQIPVYRSSLWIENTIYDTLYIFDGETLPAFPDVTLDYAEFQGWATPEGAAPDFADPVHADMTFWAVLKY